MAHRFARPREAQIPVDDDLISLANIITGRDRNPGHLLPPDREVLQQLEPYSKWLYGHLQIHSRTTNLDAIDWFRKAVHYFSDHKDGKIKEFLEAEKEHNPPDRGDEFMRKFVMECLSYWLTVDWLHRALDNAPDTRHIRKNCVADLQGRTEHDILTGTVSLKELTYNGRLVLHRGAYTDPLKSIPALALNAHKLMKFGRLTVSWTSDISQHLLIDEENGLLMLFCFPGLLSVHDAYSSSPVVESFRFVPISSNILHVNVGSYTNDFSYYVPEELTNEIQRSYWLLFNSKRTGRQAFKRALKGDSHSDTKPIDLVLSSLSVRSNEMDTVWARDKFAYLWPRILELKSHLDGSEPEKWWELLWRDKNKPYVYIPAV